MRTTDDSIGRLEEHLGRLLSAGVTAAAACLGLGLVLSLTGSAATWPLSLGLVLLIATPILRVAVSLGEYVRMRDWFFVGVTLFVLLVLAGTLLVALR